MTRPLPLWGKLAYGAGAGGWCLVDRILITWLLYFYVVSPGAEGKVLVSAFAFGLVMFLGRAIDAVADPIVARLSDNYPGRFGRRIPFMLASGAVYVVVFILLFHPPFAKGSTLNVLYLAVMLGLYFFLFTAYVTPYLALLPELARSTRDRVDLTTWKAVFSILGVAAAFVGGGILIGSVGLHGMLWIAGLVGVLLLYVPAFIKEKEFAAGVPATMGLRDALQNTFKNKPFVIYLAGNVAFWLGFNIVTLNIPGYVKVLLGRDEADTAVFFGLVLGVAFLLFPAINVLSKRLGLKTMMMLSLVSFACTLPLIFFLGQPLFGLSADVCAYLIMASFGIPVSTIFIVPDAIVASLADLEEKRSGQRREAMYFGAQGFVLKLALGISTLITGALLQAFGSTQASPLGVQLTGPVAAVFMLLGILVFRGYPEDLVTKGASSTTDESDVQSTDRAAS